MASNRVCPHCVTLFNFMGEDDGGRAMYTSTLLAGVHIHHIEGMGSVDLSKDFTRFHIFDDTTAAQPPDGVTIDRSLFNLSPYNLRRALDTPEGEKPYVPYEEWSHTTNKELYWTLNPEGKDYYAIGDHRTTGTELPTHLTLFRITNFGRREMGSCRMWHWRVESR